MKKISDAELEVMKVIWAKGKVTSMEIIKELENKNWNNNTVRTLINRLVIKKAVGISERQGKTYYYISLIKENEYKLKASQDFINKFFNGSVIEFIEFLVDYDEKYFLEVKETLEDIKKYNK